MSRLACALLLLSAPVHHTLAWRVAPVGRPQVFLSLDSRRTRSLLFSEAEKPLGATVGDAAYEAVRSFAKTINPDSDTISKERIKGSIQRLERDMALLDNDAGSVPQIGEGELFLLISTVAIAAVSPFAFSENLVEVLVPSMSALSAAVGLSAEYTGRVAVSRGKEVAAVTLQCAAESEMLLAQAERAKAIVPLCVGLATTASAFALLAPALLQELVPKLGVQVLRRSRANPTLRGQPSLRFSPCAEVAAPPSPAGHHGDLPRVPLCRRPRCRSRCSRHAGGDRSDKRSNRHGGARSVPHSQPGRGGGGEGEGGISRGGEGYGRYVCAWRHVVGQAECPKGRDGRRGCD